MLCGAKYQGTAQRRRKSSAPVLPRHSMRWKAIRPLLKNIPSCVHCDINGSPSAKMRRDGAAPPALPKNMRGGKIRKAQQQNRNGTAYRQAEQKALRHHAAHRAAAVRRNGCRYHARHGQADAGSGKRDGEQEHGEDELVKPHALPRRFCPINTHGSRYS